MPPIAVETNVQKKESPSAKPNEGANNVFTVDSRATEISFQTIIYILNVSTTIFD